MNGGRQIWNILRYFTAIYDVFTVFHDVFTTFYDAAECSTDDRFGLEYRDPGYSIEHESTR